MTGGKTGPCHLDRIWTEPKPDGLHRRLNWPEAASCFREGVLQSLESAGIHRQFEFKTNVQSYSGIYLNKKNIYIKFSIRLRISPIWFTLTRPASPGLSHSLLPQDFLTRCQQMNDYPATPNCPPLGALDSAASLKGLFDTTRTQVTFL